MKLASETTLIRNGQIVDGTGAAPLPHGAVVIEDGKITFVGREQNAPLLSREATTIDARGGTILPGLVEAHFHPTYFDVAALEDLDIKYPVEYVTLLAAANATRGLDIHLSSSHQGQGSGQADVRRNQRDADRDHHIR